MDAMKRAVLIETGLRLPHIGETVHVWPDEVIRERAMRSSPNTRHHFSYPGSDEPFVGWVIHVLDATGTCQLVFVGNVWPDTNNDAFAMLHRARADHGWPTPGFEGVRWTYPEEQR